MSERRPRYPVQPDAPSPCYPLHESIAPLTPGAPEYNKLGNIGGSMLPWPYMEDA